VSGSSIFLGYDQEALDREYNNRGKVPNFANYLARYPAESERARRELPARLDLRYGPHPGETLDVFPAPPGMPAPVQVFIHGGYWMAFDKRDFSFVARAFQPVPASAGAAPGAMVVVINYALMPTVGMDELVRQCRAAVAWVHRNAPTFGGDPGRIFLSGHSAGGHLVAMLMATDWPPFAGLPTDVVKGGTGLSGLYDLEPIRLSYLNATLGLSPEVARRHSPVLLAPPRSGRLLLAVGGTEGPEYHRQTESQASAWRPGLPVDVLDLPRLDHFSIVTELEDPASELARAIRCQMGLRHS
jgi:arylformamidase